MLVFSSYLFGLLTVVLTVLCVEGYPNQAPFKTCIYLLAHHNHLNPQTTESPYVVELNQTSYKPGDILKVSIYSPTGEKFKGFQVRAQRVQGDTEQILGNFTEIYNDTVRQYWYPDEPNQYNCIAHQGNAEKTRIDAVWQAPAYSAGDIVFKCAFVKEFTTFWSGVESSVIAADVPQEEEGAPIDVGTDESIFTPLSELSNVCGDTKGCVLYPNQCLNTGCDSGVLYSYNKDNNTMNIELFAKDAPYTLSVGFSEDKMMGHDAVFQCVSKNDKVGVQLGYSPARYTDRHKLQNIEHVQVSNEDHLVRCSFTYSTNVSLKFIDEYNNPVDPPIILKQFDLQQEHYIFLARSDVYPGTEVVQRHTVSPMISQHKIDITSISINYGGATPLFVKFHTLLGIFAWLFLISFAVFFGRHYKSVGPAWFKVHQALTIIGGIFLAAAIVLVFSVLKGWTRHAFTHAIIGLVTMGLILIQMVAGFARPGLQSKRRPLFKWGHRLVGFASYILAVVTIFFGSLNQYLTPVFKTWLTISVAVWVGLHVIIEILLSLTECRSSSDTTYNVNGISNGTSNGKAMGMTTPDDKPQQKMSTLKAALLGFLVIVNIGLAIAVTVIIFFS